MPAGLGKVMRLSEPCHELIVHLFCGSKQHVVRPSPGIQFDRVPYIPDRLR